MKKATIKTFWYLKGWYDIYTHLCLILAALLLLKRMRYFEGCVFSVLTGVVNFFVAPQ